jgi:hypothetical protein
MSHKAKRRRHSKKARQLAKVITTSVTAGTARQRTAPQDEARQAQAVPRLLASLASTLNIMKTHGVRAQLSHDAVITEYGYVFLIDGSWQVRTRNLTEFTQEADA